MRGAAGIVEQVRAAAARVASTYGLDIFDVQFRRDPSGRLASRAATWESQPRH